VQSDDFRAQEILTGRDTRWHREIDPPAVTNHAVDAPSPRAIESVFEDLEPLLSGGGCRRRVIYFRPGEVR
jgi:hypothetical protein